MRTIAIEGIQRYIKLWHDEHIDILPNAIQPSPIQYVLIAFVVGIVHANETKNVARQMSPTPSSSLIFLHLHIYGILPPSNLKSNIIKHALSFNSSRPPLSAPILYLNQTLN
jgi:hypothetical protein